MKDLAQSRFTSVPMDHSRADVMAAPPRPPDSRLRRIVPRIEARLNHPHLLN